jgi:hypothetical protein
MSAAPLSLFDGRSLDQPAIGDLGSGELTPGGHRSNPGGT